VLLFPSGAVVFRGISRYAGETAIADFAFVLHSTRQVECMSDRSDRTRAAATGEFRDMLPDEDAMKQLADGPVAVLEKRQPPGLYLLFIVEMWERFSYYGMRMLLVLYLIALTTAPNPGRGWPESDAYVLYGWYAGLAYLLPLLGGYLADRFLGTHRSMLVGGVIIALGHIVLGLTGLQNLAQSELGMSVFVGGLALVIVGTGFFKPCVSVMVGQLYGPSDPRRDGGFTIYYMGINLGAFLCAFVCGTLGEKVGWHWGFGSAAVGMIAGLVIYLIGRPRFLRGVGLPPAGQPNRMPFFFVVSLAIAALVTCLYYAGAFGALTAQLRVFMEKEAAATAVFTLLTVAILAGIVWFVTAQQPGDKGPTASIFILILFNAFFWLAYEQGGSTLNVFAERSTDRHFLSWQEAPEFLQEIPATWFQSINAALILLLGPVFAGLWTWLGRRGLDPSQPAKIGWGLLLLGGGYVFMVFAAMLNAGGALVGMWWLVATYAMFTLGELCLSPTGLSFVTKTAPVRFVSLLMGLWFVANFVANLAGGLIASYVQQIENGAIALPWYPWFKLGGRADFFLMFVITSVGTGLLILVLTPVLKRLLRKEA
jgi:proton-dependent oligopeptide transporter, POT family